MLIVLAVTGALGGAGAALASGLGAMAAVVFFGMLNGMGKDRGAALVLEQALLPATAIALLYFGARLANAVSHLGAAWLAKRIGLVNTMVFTHIPSSLLLMTIPFAPDFATAAAVFLVREGLAEMDVPTRQSYLMAVVRPEERTFASGVTHLVRMGGWAVAPTAAGALMQFVAFASPIFIGAAMKVGYDVMLYAAFRNIRPPEEQKAGRE